MGGGVEQMIRHPNNTPAGFVWMILVCWMFFAVLDQASAAQLSLRRRRRRLSLYWRSLQSTLGRSWPVGAGRRMAGLSPTGNADCLATVMFDMLHMSWCISAFIRTIL
ncbi:hypothetical protein V8C86DRAFT_57962 [Haematococcus lacustris]